MSLPNEKLASSLEHLKDLQESGRRVFRSSELTRTHRERLIRSGFLREVLQGWLVTSNPGTAAGDATPWLTSFWEFCEAYCNARFGKNWHLSPEQSLLRQAGNTSVPRQIVICAQRGANHALHLPANVSLFDLRQENPPAEDRIEQDGLQLLRTGAALVKVPQSFFTRYPVEAQVSLASVRSVSDVLGRLLAGGHSAVAGRLAGAFRRTGRETIADEILLAMKRIGYNVRESDPFIKEREFIRLAPAASPITQRLQAQWDAFREEAINVLPPAPGLPADPAAYLALVDEAYCSDAYHSLSIEGHRVSPELIERVRAGNWDPDSNEEDKKDSNAMAARGYWQAFQRVRETVEAVIRGGDPGRLSEANHQSWYRELFQPCVEAKLIPVHALGGYRNDAVFLRDSYHVPPRWDAVRDAMPAMFDLLAEETEPAARAVIGHWMLGHIHPYPDGNGRSARFLMNVMLASGGYPWLVIRVEDRGEYMAALETASVQQDIQPFAQFIGDGVRQSMERSLAIKNLQDREIPDGTNKRNGPSDGFNS